MGGITDDSLVEVSDLDFDFAIGVSNGSEVADVAVAADPDGRTLGKLVAGPGFEPLVELEGVAADVGVCGARHLQLAALFQNHLPIVRCSCNRFFPHQSVGCRKFIFQREGHQRMRQALLSGLPGEGWGQDHKFSLVADGDRRAMDANLE